MASPREPMEIDAALAEYYAALRAGAPLETFFAAEAEPVKFGITEALHGYEEIAEALREQTRTTTDWTVDSHRLQTGQRGDVGWFSDRVTMGWHDLDRGERLEWETRWSGTLVRTPDGWAFVRMHVSAVPE